MLPKHLALQPVFCQHNRGYLSQDISQSLISILFSSLEMETFENWFPGMVTSAEEYNLLKMMLMKSMMNDKDIESFAKYIHCKLNY